jgi:membrane fusion protein, multidrug efflux system
VKYGLFLLALVLPLMSNAENRFDATLQWVKRAPLSTPLSGIISEIKVDKGDVVKKGQVLARLDARAYEQEVQAAEARRQRARAHLAEAKRELARVQALYDQVLIASHELEQSKTALLAAEAEVADAEAALARARLELEYTQIRAPFDGRILMREIEIGQSIRNHCHSQTLFILAAPGLIARAWLTAEQMQTVQIGQRAQIEYQDQSYPATLTHIAWEADVDSALYALEAAFDAPLRAGLPVAVVLK